MLFNSYAFIFAFLPIAILGYFALNHLKQVTLGKMWLITASLYFYSYWNIKNLPLLLTSICVNYFIGQLLMAPEGKNKQLIFRFSLVFNIGLLCFFKYAGLIGFAKIALPLGISFFTLQQIGYLVDAYEGLTERKSFIDYAFFVSFFPQLISGPIVHYQHLMPQIEAKDNKQFNVDQFSLGIFLFSLGLIKKVLVSGTFSSWASPGFDEAVSLDLLAAWKTSLSYTFQLYFDFSGYTDMAIGLGHMFNVKLPQNFNSPFRSTSVIEFWTRWHMTLSQFINTYVFTPIVRAMPKINFRTTMIATFLAMFIAGVWHGAGINFVVYGALHGLALVVNHIRKKKKKKFSKAFAWFLTFNFINITYVIFRAKNLDDALKVLKGMIGLSGVVVPKIGIKTVGALQDFGFKIGTYLYPDDYLLLAMLAGVFWIIFKTKNSGELEKSFKPDTKIAFVCGVAFVFCLFGMNKITEFIYFNF
jgi:D-alanyl-lipoteichoic acid acyltransferase DltB (MBOAT superfamily)